MNDVVTGREIVLGLNEDTEPISVIFVVNFDTKHGNLVEWCMPNDANVKSVEFKALPSGAHNIENDFIYFRHGELFGAACYSQLRVDSADERGMRIKSVGLMGPSFSSVFRHIDFLSAHVRYLLRHPESDYSRLEELYNTSISPNIDQASAPGDCMPICKEVQPDGSFEQFVSIFGDQIMILWKLSLLGKRVLFYSQPPIGDVCYRGTSEKIFELKRQLYDVYVDDWKITQSSRTDELNDLLTITKSDKARYEELKRSQFSNTYVDDFGFIAKDNKVDTPFRNYFHQLNNRVLGFLATAGRFDTQIDVKEQLGPLCLDVDLDRTFLLCLAHRYNIPVDWMPPEREKGCCPSSCSVT